MEGPLASVKRLQTFNIEYWAAVRITGVSIILRSQRDQLELTSKSIHWDKGTFQNVGPVASSYIS